MPSTGLGPSGGRFYILHTKAQWSPTKILIKIRTSSLDSAILIFTFCSEPYWASVSVVCKIDTFKAH